MNMHAFIVFANDKLAPIGCVPESILLDRRLKEQSQIIRMKLEKLDKQEVRRHQKQVRDFMSKDTVS
jgi:hypothetical protein